MTPTAAVVTAAMLSAIHMLTLAVGFAAVVERGRALHSSLDDAGWNRLLVADTWWGIAAGLWIASGLARVFYGGRTPDFYWSNGFFWIKLGLFGIVFLLELSPMVTFIRVRAARRRGTRFPRVPVERFRIINRIEVGLVVVIVLAAALMARGAWLF